MITVGLINELRFISKAFKGRKLEFSIKVDGMGNPLSVLTTPLSIVIDHGVLDAWYLGYHIWNENMEDDVSMFGIESCHTVAEIVNLIDKNDDRWMELRYREDLTPK